METNTETKLSLKEKLYQETLDELVTKVWKYKYDKDTPIPSWSKFIEYVGEGGSNKDIEKAVKLAVEKTYDALQSGGLTEAGQSLYDRRKDIEAHTANQIFADLKAAAWQQIEPDKLKQFYKEFSEAKDEKAALEIAQKFSIVGFSRKKFDAIKKKYGVD